MGGANNANKYGELENKRKKMKIKNVILTLVVGIVLGFGAQAYATSYNFTFADVADAVSVTGTLDVTGGVATSGTVTTLAGGTLVNPGGWSLAPLIPNDVRTPDGTDQFGFDNAVPLTFGGVEFVSGVTAPGYANYAFNIWQNSPGDYRLFESSANGYDSPYTGYSGSFGYPAVPDGG